MSLMRNITSVICSGVSAQPLRSHSHTNLYNGGGDFSTSFWLIADDAHALARPRERAGVVPGRQMVVLAGQKPYKAADYVKALTRGAASALG